MVARRALGIVAYVVVGLALFVVPSAWLHARGVAWWLCAGAGALAFPLVPVAWHVLGERARRRAPATAPGKPAVAATPSTLTAGDRFVLRLAVVAAVTLGPLVGLRPGQTWHAVRDHGTWMVPRAPATPRVPHGDPRLLAEVPADAEAVLWIRASDALGAFVREAADAPTPDTDDDLPDEAVMAYRDGDLLLVLRGSAKALDALDSTELDAAIAGLDELHVVGALALRRRAGDLAVLVTPGWAQAVEARHAGTGTGPTALVDRLAAAPTDATLLFAAAPTQPIDGVRFAGLQAWLRVTDDVLELAAEATTDTPAAAAALGIGLRAELAAVEREVAPDCKAAVTGMLGKLAVATSGRTVSARGRWANTQVGEAFMCAVAAAMDDEAEAEAD